MSGMHITVHWKNLLVGRKFILGLSLIVVAGFIKLVKDTLFNSYERLANPYGLGEWWLAFRCVALFAGLVAIAIVLVRVRHTRLASVAFPVRVCCYVICAAFVLTTVGYIWGGLHDQPVVRRSIFYSAILFGLSAWLAVVVTRPARFTSAPKGLLRVVDIAVLNVMLIFLLLEAALVVKSRVQPTPFLWDDSSVESQIAAYRMKPGQSYFGFRTNSGGYHDEEFFQATKDDFVVALISDSFGTGVVPFEYNFATVAEKELRSRLGGQRSRIAVHNFGIPCLGMREYAWILENEAERTNPNIVVLAVFIGNDIAIPPKKREPLIPDCAQRLHTYRLASRIVTAINNQAHGGRVAEIGRTPANGSYAFNPDEDAPTFGEDEFLKIELERIHYCDPTNPGVDQCYERFFAYLDYFKNRVGDKLLVVLIPDEYQVNDQVYDLLMEQFHDAHKFDREYPQKRITAYCGEHGIELVDLLPPLRKEQRIRNVYKLRDTHWNAYGNRIAGKAIAEHILKRIKSASN